MTAALDGVRARRMARALGRWYRRNRRDLPWRRTREPYPVWLSEVMLQQTTVATAVPRWERFLARFPTLATLAAADEREVLAEWSGLGYYARARNLHRAARLVAGIGTFPRTVAELRGLPGVGDYTAAAVASISFDVPAAAVDGNVVRVVSRLFALRGDPRNGGPRVRALAEALVPREDPGTHNQAVMELGATVCLPRAPRCGSCPLRADCLAHRRGDPERFPAPPARRSVRSLALAAGVAFRGGRLVLIEDRHLVPGHLLVPAVALADGEDGAQALATAWPRLAGRTARALEPAGTLRHTVLDRRYRVSVFTVREGPGGAADRIVVRLVPLKRLAGEPHGGLLRKVVAQLAERAR